MNSLLNVFIPTYNRPCQIQDALSSLEKSLASLSAAYRSLVSISIHNNSTAFFREYRTIINEYHSRFANLDVFSFRYTYSGLNIGSYKNIVGGLLSSALYSDYIWILPDDDVFSSDSLMVLLPLLQEYQPCFVSGAGLVKSTFSYKQKSLPEAENSPNKLHRVLSSTPEKIDFFLDDNIVQVQEYVYQAKQIFRFFDSIPFNDFANEMFPGALALYSLHSEQPYISLERSIGIFRDDDPQSEWRHLWFRFSLIDWPSTAHRFYSLGLLNNAQYSKACSIYSKVFASIKHRPDVLSGLNIRYKLNPLDLFNYHGYTYLHHLCMSPLLLMLRIFSLVAKLLK